MAIDLNMKVPKCNKCWTPVSRIDPNGDYFACPLHGEIHFISVVFGTPPREFYANQRTQTGFDPGDPKGDKTVMTVVREVHTSSCFQGSQRNLHLNRVLEKIAQLHDKKSHDYTPRDGDPFFNFEFSSEYANSTKEGAPASAIDSFNILLGIKLARLYALTKRDAMPENEALVDSEWDFVVYFLLRESYKLKLEEEKK